MLPINNLHLFTKRNATKRLLFLLNCEVFYLLHTNGNFLTVNRIYHPHIDNILIEGIEVRWKNNPFELSF